MTRLKKVLSRYSHYKKCYIDYSSLIKMQVKWKTYFK